MVARLESVGTVVGDVAVEELEPAAVLELDRDAAGEAAAGDWAAVVDRRSCGDGVWSAALYLQLDGVEVRVGAWVAMAEVGTGDV